MHVEGIVMRQRDGLPPPLSFLRPMEYCCPVGRRICDLRLTGGLTRPRATSQAITPLKHPLTTRRLGRGFVSCQRLLAPSNALSRRPLVFCLLTGARERGPLARGRACVRAGAGCHWYWRRGPQVSDYSCLATKVLLPPTSLGTKHK